MWDTNKIILYILYIYRVLLYNTLMLMKCQPRHIKHKIKPLSQQG